MLVLVECERPDIAGVAGAPASWGCRALKDPVTPQLRVRSPRRLVPYAKSRFWDRRDAYRVARSGARSEGIDDPVKNRASVLDRKQ